MDGLLILLPALVIDLTLGEPPPIIHPVVWMGKVVSFLMRGGSERSPVAQFLYGLGVVLATVGIFVIPVCFFLSYLKSISLIAYVAIAALILKISFS